MYVYILMSLEVMLRDIFFNLKSVLN